MKTEDMLVSFKTAMLAKKKGFDWLIWYVYDTKRPENIPQRYFHRYNWNTGTVYNYLNNLCISAPTQSVLQKWLREVHKIHVNVDKEYDNNYWSTNICKLDGDFKWLLSGLDRKYTEFKSYEDALEAGLIEALKRIKQLK